MRTTKEPASRPTARSRSLPLRTITAALVTLAIAAGMASTAVTAGAATVPVTTCQQSNYEPVNGTCLKIERTGPLSAAASAAFAKAFSTPAGRTAAEHAFAKFTGAKAGLTQTSPKSVSRTVRPAWNCPGGASCGISSSGGWHFWVIVSYATIYNVGTAGFWVACTGALSPYITPVLAQRACAVVTAALWALVNNAPWTSQHGVWIAVHPTWWTGGTW